MNDDTEEKPWEWRPTMHLRIVYSHVEPDRLEQLWEGFEQGSNDPVSEEWRPVERVSSMDARG